jgi:hypothetical protein
MEMREMTKIINTLIDDIHAMLETGVDVDSPLVEQAVDLCAADIKHALYNILAEGDRRRLNNLRLSMIGKPDRQVWYSLNVDNPSVLDGQTRIKFLMGHIMEAVIIAFAQIAGHKVEGQQAKIDVEGIKGHQDCRIDDVLVDIKTASPYSFKKFKDGADGLSENDPFGYMAQISAYATAQGDEEAAFLAIEKSSAEMALCWVYKDNMIDAPKRVNALKKVAKLEQPPERCYEPVADGQAGNMKLPVGCVFCDYKKICWADANDGQGLRTFQYSNGLRHFTHVEKEPNVQEMK